MSGFDITVIIFSEPIKRRHVWLLLELLYLNVFMLYILPRQKYFIYDTLLKLNKGSSTSSTSPLCRGALLQSKAMIRQTLLIDQ